MKRRRRTYFHTRNLVAAVEGTVHVERSLYAVRWSDWGWSVVRPVGQARKEDHLRVEKFLASSGRWTARITVPWESVLSGKDLRALEEKDRARLLRIARRALRNW